VWIGGNFGIWGVTVWEDALVLAGHDDDELILAAHREIDGRGAGSRVGAVQVALDFAVRRSRDDEMHFDWNGWRAGSRRGCGLRRRAEGDVVIARRPYAEGGFAGGVRSPGGTAPAGILAQLYVDPFQGRTSVCSKGERQGYG